MRKYLRTRAEDLTTGDRVKVGNRVFEVTKVAFPPPMKSTRRGSFVYVSLGQESYLFVPPNLKLKVLIKAPK